MKMHFEVATNKSDLSPQKIHLNKIRSKSLELIFRKFQLFVFLAATKIQPYLESPNLIKIVPRGCSVERTTDGEKHREDRWTQFKNLLFWTPGILSDKSTTKT